MKNLKRVLSVLLAIVMIVGTAEVGFGGVLSIKASAAQSHTIIATTSGKGNLYQDDYSARSYPTADGKGIIVPDDDEVRILHVGDVQATAPLYEDLVHLIREGIARIKPHLIVLTGDNAMYTSTDDSFRNTIGNIVEYFYDENGKRIPFATTFGNHDTNNNKYSDDNDGAGKEIEAQWYYYTKWQGGIDFDYSDVADYGTGCINVYAANGTTIKQKVLMMNTAVDDDNGGYGKMGYNQKGSNGGFNDENCYNELCTKIAAEVNSANSIGAPVIAFQHIPLREMYTANGIVKSSTSSGINAYGSIKSDLVMPSSASANAGTKVTSLKFWPDTNPNSKWGDEITDGYCIGVMGETICCSYSSTEKIYRILANHPNTESGYTAHNNVKGIFYGHDHSNTVTGMGYIDYGSERYTLTQGYAGGMDLQHSGSDIPYISAYIVKDDVTQNLRKYTWDPTSIQEEYDVTFGAKYTVSGVPSGQTYVCDIAFGTVGTNIFRTVSDLTDDAVDNAASALSSKGYSNIVKVKDTVDGKSANLNYAGEAGTVGNKYIGMAYATTTDVSKAYTDIIIKTASDSSRPQTITKEKYGTTITYNLVSTQDLAEGTGGDYNYCYATTDPIAGPPITALGVTVGKDDDFALDGGWYQECLRQYSNGKWFQDPGDCNSGAGSNTNDVVILTKTIGSPANDNKHCLDSNVTKNYDITIQYFDLAKTYKEYESKADSYRYTTESWNAFVNARNAAKTLKEKIDVNRYITESRAQVQAVTDALVTAYNNLEEKPAVVHVDQAVSTTNEYDAPVIIAVPETIYLKAASGKATTAQYYLNNSYVNGKLTADTGSSTTGKFSISAAGADSVKVTTRQYSSAFAAVSGLTMTDSGGKDLDAGTATYTPSGDNSTAAGTVGTLTLNPGLDSNTTGLLEWQFDVTYQRDDIDGDNVREPVTLTYYAYSVLYAPYNKSVGSNIEANVDPQESSSNSGIVWYTVWISGINGLKHRDSAKDSSKTPIWENSNMTDGSAYQYASLLTEPMTDGGALYKYTGSMQWHSQQDSSKIVAASNDTANMNYVYRYWYSTSSGSRKDTNAQYGGNIAGIVYVDSSRYTNYSQIPNFKVGTDCHRINAELGDDRVGFGYDLGSNYNDTRYGDSAQTGGNVNGVPNNYYNLNNGSNAQSNLNHTRKETAINKTVAETNTKLSAMSGMKIRVKYHNNSNKKNHDVQASVYCDISYLTKSTLRELVGNAYNAGLQSKWDTNNTFNTFKTELMNAALKLGTPTDSTNSASALTTAQTNCANGQVGDGTIVNKNYGFRRVIDAQTGTTTSYQTNAFDVTSLGQNPTGTATKANWFLTQWADLSNHGYTYIGSKRATELAATVTGNTASALGLVTTKAELKSEYMVSTRSNLNAYHYYLSPDYTLTIDMDGGKIGTGNGYTSVIGNEGSTLTGTTNICTKTGYDFAGWQLVSGGGSVSGMTYTFGASNATIKALWTAQPRTVTFNANGHGTAPASQTVDYDTKATEPTAPTAAGYNFGGWYKEAGCVNEWDFNVDKVTENITLYAKWSLLCTVTFNVQGHGTAPAQQIVGEGDTVIYPGDLTATGYMFDGWYEEAACTNAWNFDNNTITGNTTIYAKWVANTYTVEYNGNGSTGGSTASSTHTYGTAKNLTANGFTKTGYSFAGWATSSDGEVVYADKASVINLTETNDATVTLYAKWTISSVTVTFNANGHGTAPASQEVNIGGKATQPTAPTATGYTFGGWYKEAACTNAWDFANDTVTAATTLYAKWTKNQYTVTFDAQGHGTAPATQTVDYNGTATKPADLTATGYTFGGWYKEAACTNAWDFANDTVTAATTLYAKWTINQYTVTFDAQGHGTAPATQTVDYNGTATKPADLTATGYTFGGWYKEAACTNAWDFSTDKITANTTIYAKWTINQYTVTFDAQGHGTAPASQTVNYNGTATQPTAPTATGYTFGGWYKEAACTNAWNFNTDKITANTTIYAKWTINQYTVTFDAQGHGTAPATQTVDYNGTATKPADLTATGYTFGGWFKEAACTNAWNFNTDKVTGNTIIYAKWTKIANDDAFVIDAALPVTLDVLANDINGATLASVDDDNVGFADGNTKLLYTPTGIISDVVSFTYTVNYKGTTATATVKIIPATSVYYEETCSFITFEGNWTDEVTNTAADVAVNAIPVDVANGDKVFGVNDVYNSTNSAVYSMGSAKKLTVSKSAPNTTNDKYAQFTFTGTGFEVYSVTNNDCGYFSIDIVGKNGTNTEGFEENLFSNNYYGYSYGELYYDGETVETVGEGGNLYTIPANKTATVIVKYGDKKLTTDSSLGGDKAFGFTPANTTETTEGLFQIPILSRKDMEYGTYTVKITPKYSSRQDMLKDQNYSFWFDSVKIFDPIDPDSIEAGSDVYNAYSKDRELSAGRQEIREILIDEPRVESGKNDGVVFLGKTVSDGSHSETPGATGSNVDIVTYKNQGPNNEVYLEPGQAIAFNINVPTGVEPDKVLIGAKMIKSGKTGTLTVASGSKEPKPINVSIPTEIYTEITDCITWSSGTTTSPIIITNTCAADSGIIISLTDIRWSYDEIVPIQTLSFSFDQESILVYAEEIFESLNRVITPIETDNVSVKWADSSIDSGETAVLTVVCPETITKVSVGGVEITNYTETSNGGRAFTYTVTPDGVGNYEYKVVLFDDNGQSSDEISAPILKVATPKKHFSVHDIVTIFRNFILRLFGRI